MGSCDNMVIFTLIHLILHRNHVCQVVKAWLSLFTQNYTYTVMIDLAFDEGPIVFGFVDHGFGI